MLLPQTNSLNILELISSSIRWEIWTILSLLFLLTLASLAYMWKCISHVFEQYCSLWQLNVNANIILLRWSWLYSYLKVSWSLSLSFSLPLPPHPTSFFFKSLFWKEWFSTTILHLNITYLIWRRGNSFGFQGHSATNCLALDRTFLTYLGCKSF